MGMGTPASMRTYTHVPTHLVTRILGSLMHLCGCVYVCVLFLSQDVCSVFVTLLGNVNERGMLVLCPALESITAASPACIPGLRQAYSKLLHLIHSGQVSHASLNSTLRFVESAAYVHGNDRTCSAQNLLAWLAVCVCVCVCTCLCALMCSSYHHRTIILPGLLSLCVCA